MNKEQKEIKRLEEINGLLSKNVDLKLINERSEIEFSLNKKNINFTLKGNNKYYYANQCAEFTKNLEKFGFDFYISKDMIKRNGICFNEYSIYNGCNQYTRVPALGTNEDFIKSMSELIMKKNDYKLNDYLCPPIVRCPSNLKKCPCINYE